MKLSLLSVKVFYRKKPKFKKGRKSSKRRKEVRSKSSPNLPGTMDNTSGTEAETNESTSSMSCSINEFETFADEVNGEIPEVDFRGKIRSEKSLSGLDETSSALTQSQIIKADRTPNFIKSLLSTRSPYDEFHRLFKTVPKDQFPINDFTCALSREILLQGRIYVSQGWVCFYSNIFGWETQVTIDCKKIQSITREKTAYVVPNAILICTEEEKHFFSSFLSRETVYKLLVQVWDEVKNKQLMSAPCSDDQQIQGTDGEPDAREDNGENDECNEDHLSCTAEHGQDTSPTDKLTYDETDMVFSKGDTKPSSLSDEDQLNSLESSRISGCAGIAMLLASVFETVYSYLQVSVRLVQRLSREQPFYIVTSIMIICLMMCSLFLLHRISLLEPKIMAKTAHPPEKILLHQSMYQLWKLRQDVFDAEVLRFKTIVAANLNAIAQVRKTLKMLEDDLGAHISRNCTLLDDNLCVQFKKIF